MTADEPGGPTPDQAVAVLLLSIEPERAASVLRRLAPEALRRIVQAMREVGTETLDGAAIGRVHELVESRLRAASPGVSSLADLHQLLVAAFGEEQAAQLEDEATRELEARRPLAVFEALDPQDLAALVAEEHPQIAAVFLANLDRGKAGTVLRHLPPSVRPDLVRRVATLDRTAPDVVARVLDVMRQKVRDLGLSGLRAEPMLWIKAAAGMLNHMGGGERRVLDGIAEVDPEIAAAVREEMFTFDDLAKLNRRGMQRILSQVDSRVLALSLKAASTEVEENVFGNLSRRAGEIVREEREMLGPTPLGEVLAAQQDILELVRSLMDSGDLSVVDEETLV